MQNFEKLEQFKKEYQKKLDKVKFSKIYGSLVFADTVRYQKQYGFDIGTGEHATWNNEADAFNPVGIGKSMDNYLSKYGSKTPENKVINYNNPNDNLTKFFRGELYGTNYSIDVTGEI